MEMPRALSSFRILSLLFSSAFLAGATSVSAQDRDPKLEALAHNLAVKIGKKLPFTRNQKARFIYVVFDFRESTGKTSQLGVRLADEFSDAMRNQLPGLRPVERSKMREFCERERFDTTAFEMDPLGLWAAKELDANLAILGVIEASVAALRLHVRALSNQKTEIADADQLLDWTEERRSWSLQTAELMPPDNPWRDVPLLPSAKGYSEPVCIYCPNPPYTDAARSAKLQGTVKLRVLIGEDGLVHGVVIVQGLPYGLSTSAAETAKKWKFKPIQGPDGRPAKVQTEVEVNFSLL
jgi:TonB family protein